MTPREEIKFIVERTPGECWHKAPHPLYVCNCEKCGRELNRPATAPINPSPHDLNALVELAEKNGYKDIDFYRESNSCTIYPNGRIAGSGRGTGETFADALRKALVTVLEREEVPNVTP